MAEVRATPRGYRRGAAWSVLLAVALTACLAWGGTVSTDLDQRLNATPATTRIQVFFLAKPPMDEDGMPFNVANAVAGLTGTEQRAAGVDALKSVTQQVLPPIAQALTAGGCTGIGIYDWASIGIAASCVPAVVRSVAARADVTFAEYNGPVGTDAVAGTLSGADIVHTRANLLSGPRGADTTVGIVDTGVSPNDPQLGGRVLCKDTGACHDSVSVCLQPYWRDAVQGNASPYDDNGHGTTMLRVAVGASTQNGSGMAPDARWVACKALNAQGQIATLDGLSACARFMLDPDNPDRLDVPAMRPACAPDVVVFPWRIAQTQNACSELQTLHRVIANLRGVGILPVFPVGDDTGPVRSPANYREAMGIAAHNNGTPDATANMGAGLCSVDVPTPSMGRPLVEGTFTGAAPAVWHAVAVDLAVQRRPDFDTLIGTQAVARTGTAAPPRTVTLLADGVVAASLPHVLVVSVAVASASTITPTPTVTVTPTRTVSLAADRSTIANGRRYRTLAFTMVFDAANAPLVANDQIRVDMGTTDYDEAVVTAAIYDNFLGVVSSPPTVAVAGLGTSLVSTGAPPTPDRAYHLVVGTVAGYPPVPNPPPPGEFTYEPDNDGVAVDRGQAVSVAGSTLLTQQFRVVHGQAFRPDLLAPGTAGGTWFGSDAAAAHVAGAAAILRAKQPTIDAKLSMPNGSFLLDNLLIESGVRQPENCPAAHPCTAGPSTTALSALDVYAASELNDLAVFRGWDLEGLQGLVAGDPNQADVLVHFFNAGTKAWTSATHRLAPVSTNALSAVATLVESEVNPGETGTFRIHATAPQTADDQLGYRFQWRVEDLVTGYASQSILARIKVRGVWNGFLFSPTVPAPIVQGSPSTFTVKGLNLGSYNWDRSTVSLREYPLATGSPEENGCPFTTNRWGTTRVDLGTGEVVQPCGACPADFRCCTKSFPVPVTIPSSTANYLFRFALYQEGVGWFGTPVTKCINTAGVDSFYTLSFSNPGELRINQGGTFSVLVRNDGTTAWNSSYCMYPQGSFAFTPGASCLGSNEQIVRYPPGMCQVSDRTFTFTAAPPASLGAGRWPISFTMCGPSRCFDNTGVHTVLVPEDHQASTEFIATGGYNSGDVNSLYWSYRYYHWDYYAAYRGWWKMNSYQDGYRRGPGDSAGNKRQKVSAATQVPGETGAARFWKSPITGRVRATVRFVDAAATCSGGNGNGVQVRIRHYRGSHSQSMPVDQLLAPGASYPPASSPPAVLEFDLQTNDTLRFIVKPLDGNSRCDEIYVDPLIQILEPSTGTGPTPYKALIVSPDIELE